MKTILISPEFEKSGRLQEEKANINYIAI